MTKVRLIRLSHFPERRQGASWSYSNRSPPATGEAIGSARATPSGTEEHEPEHAEDQDSESGRRREQREYRGPGLSLARLGWGLDDPTLFSRCCHGGLKCLARANPRRPAA